MLIHAATGGVGLTAVRYASATGAEVYATVDPKYRNNGLWSELGLPMDRVCFEMHNSVMLQQRVNTWSTLETRLEGLVNCTSTSTEVNPLIGQSSSVSPPAQPNVDLKEPSVLRSVDDDGIAIIKFNRPESFNMMRAEETEQVRVYDRCSVWRCIWGSRSHNPCESLRINR